MAQIRLDDDVGKVGGLLLLHLASREEARDVRVFEFPRSSLSFAEEGTVARARLPEPHDAARS